jgi:hypothetical protein
MASGMIKGTYWLNWSKNARLERWSGGVLVLSLSIWSTGPNVWSKDSVQFSLFLGVAQLLPSQARSLPSTTQSTPGPAFAVLGGLRDCCPDSFTQMHGDSFSEALRVYSATKQASRVPSGEPKLGVYGHYTRQLWMVVAGIVGCGGLPLGFTSELLQKGRAPCPSAGLYGLSPKVADEKEPLLALAAAHGLLKCAGGVADLPAASELLERTGRALTSVEAGALPGLEPLLAAATRDSLVVLPKTVPPVGHWKGILVFEDGRRDLKTLGGAEEEEWEEA